MFLNALLPLLLATATPPTVASLPHLVFQHLPTRAASASLLAVPHDDSASPILEHEVGRDPETQVRMSVEDLGHSACGGHNGSCDNSGDLALVAGILGFFPGFGLGDLVANNIGGFFLWLFIDLMIVAVFFIVLPAAGFALWYALAIPLVIVERVIEAFSSAASATRDRVAEALPPQRDVLTGAQPVGVAPLMVLNY